MNWIILSIWIGISCVFAVFDIVISNNNRQLFVFQKMCYTDYKDELNIIGIIILEIVVTVFTIVGDCICAVAFVIIEVFMCNFIKAFFVTFRKENRIEI